MRSATAFRGDDVLQRAALLAGDHRGVDLLRVPLLREDHSPPNR
jgi:hypothetical protein